MSSDLRVWMVSSLITCLLFCLVNGKDVPYRFHKDAGDLQENVITRWHHSRQRRQLTSRNDSFQHYDMETMVGASDKFWVDLESEGVVQDGNLSDAYRLAQTKNLDFGFRFYGEEIQQVTVSTGGFIYTSNFLHKFLTTTQYVAPLMAGFSTENANSSIFIDGSTSRFVVTWKNIYLKDQSTDGGFTFQAILRNDHTITFVYKEVPISVDSILESDHPVKAGVSDAYYNDATVENITRRTIFEYIRLPIPKEQIQPGIVIILRPLPTCNLAKTCEECSNITASLTCRWCHAVNRCSSGVDRHIQEWIENSCREQAVNDIVNCTLATTGSTKTISLTTRPISTTTRTRLSTTEQTEPTVCSSGEPGCKGKDDDDAANAALLALAALIAALLGAGAWFFFSRFGGN